MIFVFSLENESSFNAIYNYYAKMAHYRNTAEIPLILVGTQGEYPQLPCSLPRRSGVSTPTTFTHDYPSCLTYNPIHATHYHSPHYTLPQPTLHITTTHNSIFYSTTCTPPSFEGTLRELHQNKCFHLCDVPSFVPAGGKLRSPSVPFGLVNRSVYPCSVPYNTVQ